MAIRVDSATREQDKQSEGKPPFLTASCAVRAWSMLALKALNLILFGHLKEPVNSASTGQDQESLNSGRAACPRSSRTRFAGASRTTRLRVLISLALLTALAWSLQNSSAQSGVLIPSNRIAPVAAGALMSLNALAPGRIDFGISTGFTARRTMGVGPVRLADLQRYIGLVQRLIAGETVEWEFEGAARKMRFLSLDVGVVNNADPIPLHVSALGPRARALTAQLGAHWINAVGHSDAAKAAIAAMQAAWRASGIEPTTRVATAFCGGCVLAESEPFDSPRARAQAGPHATIALHNLVEREQFGDFGRRILDKRAVQTRMPIARPAPIAIALIASVAPAASTSRWTSFRRATSAQRC